jgi:vacuolar protein sorting-associated protein 13A/C
VHDGRSLLAQEFDINLEESLIWNIVEFVGQMGTTTLAPLPTLAESTNDVFIVPKVVYSKLFFELLQLQPLALNISIELDNLAGAGTVGGGKGKGKGSFNPFEILLRVAGTTLSSIESAPLRINSLVLENAFGSTALFFGALTNHFIQQAVQQSYKILGSFEFLGNPVSTVSHLGSGVSDFFYEPLEGLMVSPAAFGHGLLKGSTSLLRNSVTGVYVLWSPICNRAPGVCLCVGMESVMCHGCVFMSCVRV